MTDDEPQRRSERGHVSLSVDEVIDVHDHIVQADPEAEPGIENRGDIEYVLDHIEHGGIYEEGPATIHEKAFQLLRLLAANHPFVDGNKRTALASAVLYYAWNDYSLHYQEELEAMLILIAIREDLVNPEPAVKYLQTITTYKEGLWMDVFLEGSEQFIPDFGGEYSK
jgi:death-on-curing protein